MTLFMSLLSDAERWWHQTKDQCQWAMTSHSLSSSTEIAQALNDDATKFYLYLTSGKLNATWLYKMKCECSFSFVCMGFFLKIPDTFFDILETDSTAVLLYERTSPYMCWLWAVQIDLSKFMHKKNLFSSCETHNVAVLLLSVSVVQCT